MILYLVFLERNLLKVKACGGKFHAGYCHPLGAVQQNSIEYTKFHAGWGKKHTLPEQYESAFLMISND